LEPPNKQQSAQSNKNIKVVIGGWGAIVGNVVKSGWFAYRPTILDIFPQRINTDEAWKTSLRFRATPNV